MSASLSILILAVGLFGGVLNHTANAGKPLSAELTDLLVKLVQTPSVNGVHGERAVAEVVEKFAKANDCATSLTSVQLDRPVLTVRAGPTDVPGLLIIAHTDTVSAEPRSAWTKLPFGGEIENGRLYGRGAIDCKGGLVAGLAAVLAVKNKKSLKLPITLVCVPDEESGATGKLGILELARRGELRGRGAIYAYPGLDKIVLGHRGVYRFSVKISGRGGHTGSRAWQNANQANNALLGASDLALELEDLNHELIQTRGDGLFADYATVLTPAVIHSGTSAGQVPGEAVLTVDVRL